MRNKNLELKLIMLCNEIFDFLCDPENGADILDISVREIKNGRVVRLERPLLETSETIEMGKYEIHYKWQEKNLVQVSLYHPKYSVLYSKIYSKNVLPGTQCHIDKSCMSLSC